MRAVTVLPGAEHSARLDDVPEPHASEGSIVAETLAVGVCGTDMEIVEGLYGSAPEGEERLILGHEVLGRVIEAPAAVGIRAGELVVGIVRRPDPEPCPCCAQGEWDMCRNGGYTERGIKSRHGYMSERFRVEPEFAVTLPAGLEHVGVLLEPASVVAKAWEQIERIGSRACFEPRTALVTGAGPVGLLAALLGVQRGLDVHVLDRVIEGPKPALVAALGARYRTDGVQAAGEDADIIVECTGAAEVVLGAMRHSRADAVVCLAGLTSGRRMVELDAAAIARELVLENDVVFGSVNANRRHYRAAADALERADATWLEALISRRVPLERWFEALERRPGDVKTVVDFGQ